jgi:uncharacterized protein YqeY
MLRERLNDELKAALRAGDTVRRETIRYTLAALHNAEIEKRTRADEAGRPISAEEARLTAAEELAVLRRLVKQHHDSIAAYRSAGRSDLVEKEEAELRVLEAFLPAQLTREQIEERARAAIAAVGAQGPRDMGKVMSRLQAELRDQADMRLVSEVVRALLQPTRA